MSKHHSKIYVSYKDGSKPYGKEVVLGFSGFFGGMTTPVYTDREGVAIIGHESTGKADIYVGGKKVGSFNTPGETVVFI
jgi:hypothetical protein